MKVFLTIWFGQLISTLGSGLTGFALGVYIYQRTGSVTWTVMAIWISCSAGSTVGRKYGLI